MTDRHMTETYLLALLLLAGLLLALVPSCAYEVPEPCSRDERRELAADYWVRCEASGHDREACKSTTLCIRWDDEYDGAACEDIEAACCEQYGACVER